MLQILEESKDSEADDFEKLLLREIQEDNVEDEKIRELNKKIDQQKVKMKQDKEHADQKIEAEEKEVEKKIEKMEMEFRDAEKQKQQLIDEEMEKRRRKREEYEVSRNEPMGQLEFNFFRKKQKTYDEKIWKT